MAPLRTVKIRIAGISLLLALIVVALWLVVPTNSVERKVTTVSNDFVILRKALGHFCVSNTWYPLPDWVKDLAEDEYFRWIGYSTAPDSSRFAESKHESLRLERELGYGTFLDDFNVFPDYWVRISWGTREGPPQGYPYRDYYSRVRGHTRDPFDTDGRLYGYTRGRTEYWFLLISSGPDGDRDIDERVFDTDKPDYGLGRPLVDFTYDPTNGLVSSGDLCCSDGGRLCSPGIKKVIFRLKEKNIFQKLWDKIKRAWNRTVRRQM